MKWEKYDAYAIQSGQFTISKAYIKGRVIYTLWHGQKRIGDFDRPEEAKEAAKNGN